LYDYVVEQRGWVSREQAAEALGLQRGIAAHHLDRLADDGLLEIDYRRLNNRRGPGAGRPAKLYRRAESEVGLSLPPRDYELAGRLLADAAERSRRDGTPIEESIEHAARDAGRALAAAAEGDTGAGAHDDARRARVVEVLRQRGFEPETRADGVTVLHNCPFHQLAQAHTELVCGMNLCMLDSFLTEIDGLDLHAELEPEDGYCCVRLHSTSPPKASTFL
ncbi:MAG TPA: transcriptional regulator, partial [Acidimicrobiia bacterium]|nr:transcriptional regulator [Acidimicrobiia bacterium]